MGLDLSMQLDVLNVLTLLSVDFGILQHNNAAVERIAAAVGSLTKLRVVRLAVLRYSVAESSL